MAVQGQLLEAVNKGWEDYRQLAVYLSTRGEFLPTSTEYIQRRLGAIASNLELIKKEVENAASSGD